MVFYKWDEPLSSSPSLDSSVEISPESLPLLTFLVWVKLKESVYIKLIVFSNIFALPPSAKFFYVLLLIDFILMELNRNLRSLAFSFIVG